MGEKTRSTLSTLFVIKGEIMKKLKLMTILGNRPEIIKMSAIIKKNATNILITF